MVESVDGDEEYTRDHDTPCTSRDGHSNMSPRSIRSSLRHVIPIPLSSSTPLSYPPPAAPTEDSYRPLKELLPPPGRSSFLQ